MANLPTNYAPDVAAMPPQGSYAVTPSDTAYLSTGGVTYMAKGLFVEVGGNVKVTWANGSIDTLPLAAGGHKMLVKQVWSTGTTATGIHAYV